MAAAFALALTGCQLVSGLHDVEVVGVDDGTPPPDLKLQRCLGQDGSGWAPYSSAQGASQSWEGSLIVMSSDGPGSVQYKRTDTDHWDECYVSVKLVAANPTPGGGFLAGLSLVEDGSDPNFFALYWDAASKAVTTPYSTLGAPVMRSLVSQPSHLGLAFHEGQVYFAYAVNGTWAPPLWIVDRPAFLDDGTGEHLVIGYESDFGGTASFADIDSLPIGPSDL